jgi:hypothetical protein
MLAAAGLSAVPLRLDLGRQIRTFEAVDGAIADFERGAWRSAAAGPVPPVPAHDQTAELRQLLDAAETRYRAAGRTLATAAAGKSSEGRP